MPTFEATGARKRRVACAQTGVPLCAICQALLDPAPHGLGLLPHAQWLDGGSRRFMVKEVEAYVRENLGDVVQEGRWRVVLSKEMSRFHFKSMAKIEATHELLVRQQRDASRAATSAGGGAAAAGGTVRDLHALARLPSPAAANGHEVQTLRTEVAELKETAVQMTRGLAELRADMRAHLAALSPTDAEPPRHDVQTPRPEASAAFVPLSARTTRSERSAVRL